MILSQAFLVEASYCSKELHIPDGTVGVHTVQGQEQQTSQQGHAHPPPYLHPRPNVTFTQAPQTFVELQQVVVENPNIVATVGPTTLAFPGYDLLLTFVGRNGAISYTSVDAMPTDCGNTSAIIIFIEFSIF